MILVLSMNVALSQQWTSEPVAGPGPIRSIGMAVDGASGERFFVLDTLSTQFVRVPGVGQVRVGGPEVRWVSWDGTQYSPSVVVADGVEELDSYMPHVATARGSPLAVVGARFHAGQNRTNFETILVDRASGQVLGSSTGVTDDFEQYDQGRLTLLFDGSSAHACFTAHFNGDDLVVNHTIAGQWQDPLTGFGYTFDYPGVQDHCGMALRPDGTRAVVHHESGRSEHVFLTLEDSVGVVAPGFPREVFRGRAARDAGLDHPFVTVDPSADVIHVVASAVTHAGFGVLHTSCAIRPGVTCAILSDWTPAEPVVPIGSLAEEPWPEVALDEDGTVYVTWLDERSPATDEVHVAWRCQNSAAFVEDGPVEGHPGDKGFGSYGSGDVHNPMLGGPHLAIDAGAGTVGVAYLLLGQGTSLPMNAWRPLATCP